jgi:ribosomal protein S18 acetylase RimI-like enzyme
MASARPEPTRTPYVRRRAAADISACVCALKEVHESDGYPVEGVGEAEKWLSPDGLIQAWVVGKPDSILGHAALCRPQGEAAVTMLIDRTGLGEDRIAVIARLFVVPRARGHSLGQHLALAAFNLARQLGRRVVFDVMAKDTAAIRLYERLGCERLGATAHTFGAGQHVPAYCYAAPAGPPATV